MTATFPRLPTWEQVTCSEPVVGRPEGGGGGPGYSCMFRNRGILHSVSSASGQVTAEPRQWEKGRGNSCLGIHCLVLSFTAHRIDTDG